MRISPGKMFIYSKALRCASGIHFMHTSGISPGFKLLVLKNVYANAQGFQGGMDSRRRKLYLPRLTRLPKILLLNDYTSRL